MPPSDHSTYADYYERSVYGRFVSESRSLNRGAATFTSVHQPAGAYPDPALPFIAVGLFRSASTQVVGDLGAGKFRANVRPGTILVTALNTATNLTVEGPHTILIMGVPAERIRALVPEWARSPLDFGCLHKMVLHDALIEHICLRLWAEARAKLAPTNLLADGAIMTLLGQLQSYASGGSSLSGAQASREANWRIRRSAEYLRAHLGQDTTLSEVAAVAGLSPFHFARQFRKVFGVSPHRYVIELRIERARELLARTRRTVGSIGFDLGFSTLEHFSNTFRKTVGVSPRAYRLTCVEDHRTQD